MFMRKGAIVNGIVLTPDETATIDYLRQAGYEVTIIQPIHTKGQKNPDIIITDQTWEIKCPRVNKRTSLERLLRDGSKQSPNLIFDMRKIKQKKRAIETLQSLFKLTKRAKKIMLITRHGIKFDKKGR